MSQIQHIEHARIDNLKEVWNNCNEIARSMAYPNYFCSGDWLNASAESICSDDELLILLLRHDDCVKAVLPLVSKRNALGGRDLSFLGADFHPDPIGLICSHADRPAFATAIKEYLLNVPGWDRIFLNWVLEDEALDWKLPYKPVSTEPFKTLPQSFSLLLGEFKRKKRYNLRAMVQKVLESGGELLISDDNSTHSIFLECLFSLHQKRSAERELKSSFEGPRVIKFHRRLIEKKEGIRFYGLQLNHRKIAVIYGFEFCKRFFYYQVAHDPDYADLSPGTVLLFLAIEDCCSRGITEFNFLQGNERYKDIWTRESRVLYQIVLTSGTMRSFMLKGFDHAKEELKKIAVKVGGGP